MVTRQREAPLQVILPGFTLKPRGGWPLFQLTRLALIVAVPDQCGGPPGTCPRADAAVARRA